MEKERIYKILMATGIEELDQHISDLENCETVGVSKNRTSIYDDIEEWNPQVVILSDWLKGDRDMIELMIDLKRMYQFVRIIYLAGVLDMRDQKRVDDLGRMVLSGIYDLCISKDISLEVVDHLIKHPKEESSVSYLAKNILNNTEDHFVKEEPVLSGLAIVEDGKRIMDNVYVFTSIKPGTGKSFLSVNSACAIAAYGKKNEEGEKPKVALIEADLQTLSIGTILDIKEDKKKNMKCAMEAISTIFDGGNIIGDDNDIYLVEKIIKDCMVPYSKLDNLHVLTGSTLTPEEIDSLKISPEYYIYLLDVIRKEYDVVIIDTNSSMTHVTTYPILQKAKQCFYILNLDINNVRNNLRYYETLKKLNLIPKIKWIMNENLATGKKSKEQGTNLEKLAFTADEFEKEYFALSARIPVIPKAVFLNRIYNGTPVVLDENIPYTREAKDALRALAGQIWELEEIPKKTGFFGFFQSKPKEEKKEKPKKEKKKKVKEQSEEEKEDRNE